MTGRVKADEVPQEWMEAFGAMFALARKYKFADANDAMKVEAFNNELALIGLRAGLTMDETWHYGQRAFRLVQREASA